MPKVKKSKEEQDIFDELDDDDDEPSPYSKKKQAFSRTKSCGCDKDDDCDCASAATKSVTTESAASGDAEMDEILRKIQRVPAVFFKFNGTPYDLTDESELVHVRRAIREAAANMTADEELLLTYEDTLTQQVIKVELPYQWKDEQLDIYFMSILLHKANALGIK